MNEALSQMVQQRLGLSQADLDAISGGDVSAIVARSSASGSDPLLLALMASLMRRPAERDEGASESDSQRTLERARRVIQKLKEDLAATDVMIKYIAQVFGACPSCWGMNQFCLRCQGKGKPGTSEPVDDVLFQWAKPALQRVGWRIVQAGDDVTRQ